MESTNTEKLQVRLIDAIDNKVVTQTSVLMNKGDVWALDNSNNRISTLLDKTRSFKIVLLSDETVSYRITPIKFAKDFIIVKLIKNISGRERRRYLRVTCNITTSIVFNNNLYEATIKELAYGSIAFKVVKSLNIGDKLSIKVKELDGETMITGHIMDMRENQTDEADLWFDGHTYILEIDETATSAQSMELLYGKIYRMQRDLMDNVKV